MAWVRSRVIAMDWGVMTVQVFVAVARRRLESRGLCQPK